MKIPSIFIPEKKLDLKVEELLKEAPWQNPQLDKQEIPNYAVQENGDYLVMRDGIILNMHGCKKMSSSTFYFTIGGEEHKLYIGNKEVTQLDEKFVSVEESLISKLIGLGIKSSYEPDYDSSDWKLEMKHATEEAYKELVKFV